MGEKENSTAGSGWPGTGSGGTDVKGGLSDAKDPGRPGTGGPRLSDAEGSVAPDAESPADAADLAVLAAGRAVDFRALVDGLGRRLDRETGTWEQYVLRAEGGPAPRGVRIPGPWLPSFLAAVYRGDLDEALTR